MKHYSINEIFYSLQGEGVRAGTANIFVRFAGCNLTCQMESHGFDCDTEFSGGIKMTAEEILDRCGAIGNGCRSVIFTGGEPLLQLDNELLQLFETWFISVETNGSKPLPFNRIDWVTVSPKVAEHALQLARADEVKYVRHAGQALPKPQIASQHYLLSPAWNPNSGIDRASLEWCIQLCKENPQWRLSVQQHKLWQVR